MCLCLIVLFLLRFTFIVFHALFDNDDNCSLCNDAAVGGDAGVDVVGVEGSSLPVKTKVNQIN